MRCNAAGRLEDWKVGEQSSIFQYTWNTLGALIRSLQEAKVDGSWDHTYKATKEEEEPYDV